MNVRIDSFLDYLRYERNYSEYTIGAYSKDLQQFEDFVKEKKEGIFAGGSGYGYCTELDYIFVG